MKTVEAVGGPEIHLGPEDVLKWVVVDVSDGILGERLGTLREQGREPRRIVVEVGGGEMVVRGIPVVFW
jgi:hypothetical protein